MNGEPTDSGVEAARASRLTWSEALFQALLDGLLILLYMTACMVFIGELMDRPMQVWMWAIQAFVFAAVFGGLRMAMTLRGHKALNDRAKLRRQRWMFFIMSGTVVAAASAVELILHRSLGGPMAGLAIAGTLMALAGVVGIVRTRRATTDGPAS